MNFVKLKKVFSILFSILALITFSQAQEIRGLRVSDIVKLENFEYDSFRFSPDGKALAFGLIRPLETERRLPENLPLPFKAAEIDRHSRSDVWLQEAPGRTPHNVTNGLSDGSGWWEPRWSPDGERLAMISSRGGQVAVWIWEQSSGTLYSLRETNNISLRAMYSTADSSQLANYLWVDNHHLLCSVSQNNQTSYPMAGLTLARGTELTASVLDSGVTVNPKTLPQAQIRLVDVTTQTSSLITTEAEPPNRARRHVLASDRKTLAVSRMVGLQQPKANAPILSFEDADPRYGVELHSLNGELLNFDRKLPETIVPGSIRWSQSGKKLALLESGEEKTSPLQLWLIDLDTHQARQMDPDKLQLRNNLEAEWNSREELMFKARMIDNAEPTKVENTSRESWWVLTQVGEKRPLSDDERKKSSTVLAKTARRERFEQTVKKPSERAVPAAFSADHQTAVYREDGPSGLFAWRVSAGKAPAELLVKTNLHLAEITAGEFRQIEYISLNGLPLKGALMLPVGYKPGRRYPLVVSVYAGADAGNLDGYKRVQSISTNHITNSTAYAPLQFLAAQGYAVLFPSMPLRQTRLAGGKDGPQDPLLTLTDGVLPALEKVVSLGIADEQRIFIMGHSYGGYSTYGLITQTNRFKAAVAMNGFTNLISSYGTFDARKRYLDESHLRQSVIGNMEIGQGAMESPPWKDSDRYLRNSPLTYVEQVQTPLLMIHSDLDFVPLQQAEEFFTALYRQGKRAQFVRYWGEEHTLSSAANIHDMWSRIFAWFDDFGDISRDQKGEIVFEEDRPKSRNGGLALTPEEFIRFDRPSVK